MQEHTHLSKLLNTYNSLSNVYVSVTDLSGVLSHPLLNIPQRERIHARRFCDIAKSTAKGFRSCKRCRFCADRRAIKTKQLFHGHCIYGLYEIGMPVVAGDKTIAVVYVGNLLPDAEFSKVRAATACSKTGVDYNSLKQEFDNAQSVTDLEPYINIAETVCSYIKLVLKTIPFDLNGDAHWIVREIKLYARENFRNDIKLSDLAKKFGFNEKYIGRLFKSTANVSFTQYVNRLRLGHAKGLLLSSEKTVIEIALDCGFENVTYFNRVFRQSFNMTPTEFRRQRPMIL